MSLETITTKDLKEKIERGQREIRRAREAEKELEELKSLLAQEEQAIKEYLEKISKEPLKDDREIKRIEVIILNYKEPDIESEAVGRVIHKTKWPYKLNVYDNRPNSHPHPPNFAKIWNKLVMESTCDYMLIMDSDAYVETEGWLTKLMETFNYYPNARTVGPVAGNYGTVSTIQNREPEPGFTETEQLSGYCFLMKRQVFEEIGQFNERFIVFGQDSDFFSRVKEAGFGNYVNLEVLVFHGKEGKADTSLKKREREEGWNWRLDSEIARALFEKEKKEREELKK